MPLLLHLTSVILAAIASVIVAVRLQAIAEKLPPTSADAIERTNLFFLARAGKDPRGKSLIRWFWLSQAALVAAALAWLASWPA